MRFHLVDRIEEICYGKYATAVKCVSLADEVFNEHFPGYPVFPGSLLIESLAQLGGSFFELSMKHQGAPLRRAILSMLDRVRFRKPVVPGDKLVLRAQAACTREEFGIVSVSAAVDGDLCVEGELTFSFVELDVPGLQESRLELYRICTANTRTVEG